MTRPLLLASAIFALTQPAIAQDESDDPPPGPSDIVNAAPQSDWAAIAPEDLLVMTLAPDAEGNERNVVIQLMPAPFSQGWVSNIRTLARAKWYDGISVNRVQENYVVQWGDPGHDNPESGDIETKPLPDGLQVMEEAGYSTYGLGVQWVPIALMLERVGDIRRKAQFGEPKTLPPDPGPSGGPPRRDDYQMIPGFFKGWPTVSLSLGQAYWPVHCYGMVGVGRNYSPDTGTGAELYTVIGHAPRHLDRNIALVGRIIGGMEHLSSLPRGSGALGFYTEEEAERRTPILSVRIAADLPADEQPQFEYLSTETETFAKYAEARANRRDPFFIWPAGGADICNIPVPVRPFEYTDGTGE